MKCATHPDIETGLCCGKCDKPICPKCMVQTPVGARCRKCAGLNKLPTFHLSSKHYVFAILTGLGMSAATGITWTVLVIALPFYLNLLIGPAIGWVIGEVIGLSVNRKRGTVLAVIAGTTVVFSYLIALFVPWGLRFSFFDILAVVLGIFVASRRIR